MKAAANLAGRTFGRYTVLGFVGRLKGFRAWACACSCGAITRVITGKLLSGRSQSCGCRRAEIMRAVGQGNRRHGQSRSVGVGTPTYSSWAAMWRRCRSNDDVQRRSYKDRGVAVCERWKVFEHFLADMGERPAGTSLDRFPNRDGGYEPANCRWATPTEQGNNRRTNVMVTIGDETLSMTQWCSRNGVNRETAYARVRRGWAPGDAVRGSGC